MEEMRELLHRQSTDTPPTLHRHPTDRQTADSSPTKLSANRWPTNGRQMADRWPTDSGQTGDRWPTDGRQGIWSTLWCGFLTFTYMYIMFSKKSNGWFNYALNP